MVVKPPSLNCSKSKSKSIFATKADKAQQNFENEIADLKVECINKDRTIHDYEKYIEEMKEQTLKLQIQIKDLDTEKMQIKKQHEQDIKNMVRILITRGWVVLIVFFFALICFY